MAGTIFDRGSKPDSGGIFETIYNRMYRSNPQFRDFANQARGKSIEEVCAQHGIDPSQVRNMDQSKLVDFMAKNGLI